MTLTNTQTAISLLENPPEEQRKRRSQGGIPTTELVLSSHTSENKDLFPKILALHLKEGAVIADVTFGKGIFWKNVSTGRYKVLTSDIKTGIDARKLSYKASSLDALVLDPPYMEGLYRDSAGKLAGSGTHDAFRNYYSSGTATAKSRLRYHDQVLDMYMRCAVEARRVLKKNGVFIVKCQDEVSANRQKLTHVELIYGFESLDFYCKDLFVITRHNKPVVSRLVKQEHARKNHSYFLVFVNKKETKLPHSNFRSLLNGYTKKSK